jgi:D-3-phosphoglycerate dehydrogenase
MMAKPVVLLTWGSYYTPGWIDEHWPLMAERCELRYTEVKDGPEWNALVAEADVVIPRRWDVKRDAMAGAPGLRGIVTVGVGVEKVDVESATDLGIVVANSPGNYPAVAESALLLMGALSKMMSLWVDAARTGQQPGGDTMGSELYGKTLGIVGLGRVGKWVAGLAKAYGMDVIAYDPYVDESDRARLTSLDEVLRRSDFLSLHPVLTPETRQMIGAEQISMMKPSAFLINTSRGGVLDEAALIEALQRGDIAGAGLDVFEVEPPELDNPLLRLPNVIATPHALPRTVESVKRCADMTQESVLALIEGKLPQYTVNKDVKWRFAQSD